jgi:hypothetical protein
LPQASPAQFNSKMLTDLRGSAHDSIIGSEERTLIIPMATPELSIIDRLIETEPLLGELRDSLEGLFQLTHAFRKDLLGASYLAAFAKPSRRVRDSLFIDREVLILWAQFSDIQARTVQVVQKIIDDNAPRLFPSYAVVIHADRAGNSVLKKWGREKNIAILPIYRAQKLPTPRELERTISRDLHSIDPFDVSVAVVDDRDFYGRRAEAIELARQVEAGSVRSLFALRKVGKTSILDRVVKIGRDTRTFACAVADCSKDFVWKKDADEVISVFKGALAAAAQSEEGYAAVEEKRPWGTRPDSELFSLLKKAGPVVWIFDEVDYLTPTSPTDPARWVSEFNVLWRQVRAFLQEAHRRECRLGLLVCGVSSKWFRAETIGGIENAALTIVPETYLAPFPRGASESMLKELGKRCGLRFNDEAAGRIAEQCGDFPFWMRKAGSYLHRHVSQEQRPLDVAVEQIDGLLREFVEGEGAEIAATSVRHFLRQMPELRGPLESISREERCGEEERRLLSKYGLVKGHGGASTFALARHALARVLADKPEERAATTSATKRKLGGTLDLSEADWAEELGAINKRRNVLEKRLREMAVMFLQSAFLGGASKFSAHEAVLASIDQKRRPQLAVLETRTLAEELYFRDLYSVIANNWSVFEKVFGDRGQLEASLTTLNSRPDAHAKEADALDIARQRDALEWLEARMRF